ncbi:MAG: F0F1 ATP synthase subunit delta [Candidatus Pacebacteria bacterium]|nr:F0F1 ATP synthase subunit delta [Candidatus Paceibacterota bacterium]
MVNSYAIARVVYELAQDTANKNIVENLVSYLQSHHLMPLLDSVLYHVEHMHARDSAQESLDIISAYPLQESFVSEIKKILGAKTVGSRQQNKDLIGGFIMEHNGVRYDASVSTQLIRLTNVLTS